MLGESQPEMIASQRQEQPLETEPPPTAPIQSRPDRPGATRDRVTDTPIPDPASPQLWLGYIDTLIHTGQLGRAGEALHRARGLGLKSKAVDRLAVRLAATLTGTYCWQFGTTGFGSANPAGSSGKKATRLPSRAKREAFFRAFERGNVLELERLALAMTHAYPQEPLGWKGLGLSRNRLGKNAEALNALRKAVQLQPNDVEIQNNLAMALSSLGQHREAEYACRRAIALQPDSAEAYNNLAVTLNNQNRLVEAEASYRQAIALWPDFVQAHHNLAHVLSKTGRHAEAEARYRRVLALWPENAEAHDGLGTALRERGRLAEAAASYEQALSLDPGNAEVHCNLGVALSRQGRFAEAERSYRAAIALRPEFAEAHNNLALALSGLGRFGEAESSHRHAIALEPEFVQARNNLGSLLLEQGRLEEAAACYEQALATRPDYAECHWNLSELKKYSAEDPHLAVLRRLVGTAKSDSDRATACFALAKACDDIEAYDEAFAHYAEGNRLRKAALGYQIDQDRHLFNRIMAAFERLPELVPVAMAASTPILIVGMPRSGTTLVEQILASHSEVTGAGELDLLDTLVRDHFLEQANPDLTLAVGRIASGYLNALDDLAQGRRYVTDKMTLNFRWLGFLLLARPEIKVVCTIRDPVAVCWSNYKIYYPAEGLGFAYDLADLVEYHRLYEELMQFWRARFPGRICELNYERLTEDQEQETRRLLDYCGLGWEEGCLWFEQTKRVVKTASGAQVRRKLYQGSSEAWRKYRSQLGPLLEGLGVKSSNRSPS